MNSLAYLERNAIATAARSFTPPSVHRNYVEDQEYVLDAGCTLVSATDLNSYITYLNEAFEKVSGYTREELMGQPHNMIRHPDMPKKAFADMWATIKSGLPWSGLVKNRRKDGRYYWVRANVMPIKTNGQITGYLSVRTCPTREEVSAIKQIYADLRGEGKGIYARRIQPIDATHSLNISAGVLYPKVFLGRSFNFLAIASKSS